MSRQQVRALLDSGLDYRAAAGQLGIPAGLAYLIATGRAADGGDAPGDDPAGALPSSQHLSNPPHDNPTSSQVVHDWIVTRAATDKPMQDAARRRAQEAS